MTTINKSKSGNAGVFKKWRFKLNGNVECAKETTIQPKIGKQPNATNGSSLVLQQEHSILDNYIGLVRNKRNSSVTEDFLKYAVRWMSNCVQLILFLRKHNFKLPFVGRKLSDDDPQSAFRNLATGLEEIVVFCFQQAIYAITKCMNSLSRGDVVKAGFLTHERCQHKTCGEQMINLLICDLPGCSFLKPRYARFVLDGLENTLVLPTLRVRLLPWLVAALYGLLGSVLDRNPFTESDTMSKSNGMSKITSYLNIQQIVCRGYRMPENSGPLYYNWTAGVRIRTNLGQIEDWAQRNGFEEEFAQVSEKLLTAAEFLSTSKSLLLKFDWMKLKINFQPLNEAQLYHLVCGYDNGDKSPPSSWLPSPEDKHQANMKEEIPLEMTAHPPFLIPQDNGCIDLIHPPDEQAFWKMFKELHPNGDTASSTDISTGAKKQFYKLSYESDTNSTPKTSTPSSPKHPPSSKRQESINRRLDLLITNNNLNVPENFQNGITPIEDAAPPLPPRSYKFPSSPTSPQLTNGSLSLSANSISLKKQLSHELEDEDPLGRENLAQVNRQIYESLGQMSPTNSRPPLVPVLGTTVKSANNPVFSVGITKGDKGLGLGLIDGLYTPLRLAGIYIRKVLPGSPAADIGRLQVGDRLLCVNGKSIVGADYQSAMKLIRAAGEQLTLLVAKGNESIATKISSSSC
ncbi:hypothetical protein AM593_09603, partial [Mytilus galloprovincialis]